MEIWQGISTTTINEYFRDVEDVVLRDRVIPYKLSEEGRITYGHSGQQHQWPIRVRRQALQGYSDMQAKEFPRFSRDINATLPYRGAYIATFISHFETLANRGFEAIVNILDERSEKVVEDLQEGFGNEFFLDGNLASRADLMHGIESFMGGSTPATNGYIVNPDDSYAGLDTDLQAQGGDWDVDSVNSASIWPDGEGDPDYECHSPVKLDTSDTIWTGSATTFAESGYDQLTWLTTVAQKDAGKANRYNLATFSRSAMYDLKLIMQDKENVYVQRGDSNLSLAMGIDVLNICGLDCLAEYGILGGDSAVEGYVWNTRKMSIMSMEDQLFTIWGPVEDDVQPGKRLSVHFWGNFKFNSPRYFAKLSPVTS